MSNPRWSNGHAKAGRIRNFERRAYLNGMSKAFEFCIPTRGTKVPETPDWLHEIKYDGYRLRVERDGVRIASLPWGSLDQRRWSGLR